MILFIFSLFNIPQIFSLLVQVPNINHISGATRDRYINVDLHVSPTSYIGDKPFNEFSTEIRYYKTIDHPNNIKCVLANGQKLDLPISPDNPNLLKPAITIRVSSNEILLSGSFSRTDSMLCIISSTGPRSIIFNIYYYKQITITANNINIIDRDLSISRLYCNDNQYVDITLCTTLSLEVSMKANNQFYVMERFLIHKNNNLILHNVPNENMVAQLKEVINYFFLNEQMIMYFVKDRAVEKTITKQHLSSVSFIDELFQIDHSRLVVHNSRTIHYFIDFYYTVLKIEITIHENHQCPAHQQFKCWNNQCINNIDNCQPRNPNSNSNISDKTAKSKFPTKYIIIIAVSSFIIASIIVGMIIYKLIFKKSNAPMKLSFDTNIDAILASSL